MKTMKYVPTQARGEDAKFSGFVELRLPRFEEKLKYLESLNITFDEDGTVDLKNKQSNVKTLINMLEIAADHYVTVDLKHIDGREYKDYDDLSVDSDCQSILTEISSVVLNGPKMGNG